MVKKDLTGQKFGNLTVIRDSGRRYRTHVIWECIDTNGDTHFVKTCNLKRKNAFQINREKPVCRGSNAHNEFDIRDEVVYVAMSNDNDFMICDCDNWEELKSYVWAKSNNGYACSNIGGKKTLFHDLVMKPPSLKMVDHINGNKLDNRKANLRVVTRSVNCFNRHKPTENKSGKVGVYEAGNKWVARICVDKKKIYLGRYTLLTDAIEARKKAELKYYGEYCAV